MRRRVAGVIVAVGLAIAAPVAQDTQLQFRGKPQLVDCDGRACFRMFVEAIDAKGQPVELPDQPTFEVTERGRPVVVSARKYRESAPKEGVSQAAAVPRVTLVLFDTSGSMGQMLPTRERRFDAAKKHLAQLAAQLRDGIDQMAVAPFDSVNVVSRIAGAEFQSTRAGVQAQIDRLRLGANTALYSAVAEGVKKIEAKNVSSAQVSLIVFTDGKNDVISTPHDPGLLGDDDLPKVLDAVRRTGVQVYAIGFGTAGQHFDENVLRALAYPNPSNYFGAADAGRLNEIFKTIEARSKSFVRLLVALPERHAQLPSTIEFTVRTGQLMQTSPTWERSLISEPPRGDLTAIEREEMLKTVQAPVEGLPGVVIRMLVLLTYAAVLAGLWFGLPRVIWPERYIPKPAFQAAPPRAGQGPGGRPGSQGSRQPGRPEVTLPPNRPPMRANPTAPGRRAEPQPPPGRVREAPRSPQPAQPPEPLGPRDAGDATVFIPPKKPGRDG